MRCHSEDQAKDLKVEILRLWGSANTQKKIQSKMLALALALASLGLLCLYLKFNFVTQIYKLFHEINVL